MDTTTSKTVTQYQKRRRWNRTWKRITTVLASVVVFITTYALILPAITMEPEYICGKDAHVHTDACYQLAEPTHISNLVCTFDTLKLHTHTTECYNEDSELICGYADFVLHTHNSRCYNQSGALTCVLPEIEAHIHDESCWKQPHVHTESCYLQQRGELLCTVEEGSVHTHLDTCYTPQQALVCTASETVPHTHSIETCYTETKDLLCTEPEVAAHFHSDSCYTVERTMTCTMEELDGHAHSDACYDENGTLTCSMPEIIGHKHDDACYQSTTTFSCILEETAGHTHVDVCYSTPVSTLTCTIEETEGHTHGTDCFETVGVVTCALEENVPHAHTDACFLCTPVLQCTELTAEENVVPVLSCEKEELIPHTHDAFCLDESGAYICGKLELYEHIHEDACFIETVGSSGDLVLICGYDAHEHTEECIPEEEDPTDPTLPEEETLVDGLYCGCAEHAHLDGCFNAEGTLMCTMSEHQHNWICALIPSDFSAVETADDWEADLPELQGDLAADLIAVAESQLGYKQVEENYIIEDDEQLFYSRYGAWWDEENPYGEWNAKFVSFCLHYADAKDFPQDYRCSSWVATLKKQELYAPASEYIPSAGDIIFFNWDADASAEHVGIVTDYFPEDDNDTARIRCIEGNRGNAVRYATYDLTDSRILGYGQLIPERIESSTTEDVTEDDPYAAVANVVSQGTNDVALFSGWSGSISLLTSSPAASARNAVITGTVDMADLIDAVTVYKKQNGAWVKVESGGTVTQGEDLKFTIDYTVDGMVLSDEANTLVYKIPDNVTNVLNSTGSVYNDSKTEVGTFTIDAKTNTITITFFDDYVDENKLNKAIEGSISFYATVENVTQGGDKPTEILFADKVKIEMEVVEKEESIGDVKVEKSIAKVNGTEITYQVKVSSKTGTFSKVTLTDTMTTQAEWWTPGHLTFNPESLTVNTSSYEFYYHYNEFTVVLPQMAAGDEYIITYTAELTGELNGHPLVNNKATATSKDSQNIDISDFAEVDHTFRALDKSGKRKEDGSVEWTIVINEDKMDLSGAVLRDVMTDTDGTEGVFTGPVTITDSKGNSKQITLPYTFPNGSSDTYTITYVTTHKEVSGENVVVNNVRLQYGDNDDWFVDGEEVVIGTNNPLKKEGKFLSTDPGTGKSLIQWTVTVDTSGGPLPAMTYIRDAMYEEVLYLTYEQLKAAFAAVENAVKPYQITIAEKIGIKTDGTYVSNEAIDAAGDSNLYRQFIVQFREEIPKGARFSFSFTVTADGPPDSGLYYNQVTVNDSVYADSMVRHDFTKPTIAKHGVDMADGANKYEPVGDKVELDYDDLPDEYKDFPQFNGEKTVWWRLRLQVPTGKYAEPIIVKDTLPEGLELMASMAGLWGLDEEPYRQIVIPNKNGFGQFFWFPNDNGYPGYNIDLQTSTGADGRQIVTFTVDDMAVFLGENGTFVDMFLICRFRDDFDWGDSTAAIVKVPFENGVRIERPNGDLIDTDDHTYIIEYDKSDEFVSKSGALNQLNELEYSVVLNKNGRDLDPDESTIKVQDVLTYDSPAKWPIQLYLKSNSVKVYDYTGGVKGALITTTRYTYKAGASGTGDITYTHTLDLVLPDSQAMLLEYVYTVDGEYNESYSYDMINTCTITGIANGSISGDEQFEIKVYDSSAEANIDGIYIRKVDSSNYGLYLPDAVFNLYTWNKWTGQYVRVKHPNTSGKLEEHYAFVTASGKDDPEAKGLLILNRGTMETVAYNTAYYIVEVAAPDGYFKNPEPYYFYIHSADAPYNLPEGFKGDKLNTGALIYYENEPDTTELVIHKKWQDSNGTPITVKADQVESVSFELWQKLEGDEDSDTLYGTYTITPDANGFWEKTITDLPKGTPKADGTIDARYLYYIREVTAPGYEVSYEYDDANDATINDSGGINSGTIDMTNRKQQGYELPETGGAGMMAYRLLGSGMMLLPIPILWRKKKMRPRGRGADGS